MPNAFADGTSGFAPPTVMMVRMPIFWSVRNPGSPSGTPPE